MTSKLAYPRSSKRPPRRGGYPRLAAGWFTLLVGILPLSAPLAGEPAVPEDTAADFESCKVRLLEQAVAAGRDADIAADVLSRAEQLARVVKQDRAQAEFTETFTEYYNKRVNARRIEQGRRLRAEHAPLLAAVEQRTGVPAQYLLALWGLETNFGGYFGTLSIPSALTTLACDPRRSRFFSQQLFDTIAVIEAGDATVESLVGSWAGAIGHMQFMPSTFLAYAIDADGDGQRDLYGSLADALSSGGNYLQALGWQPGYRWGREVVLPNGFDYSQAGMGNWQALSHWSSAGVRDVFDRPLPALDLPAALLVPTGHTGPAFIVYENFKIIMKWNRSLNYALSVGRLADRIAGAGGLSRPLPAPETIRLSREDMLTLQANLNFIGLDTGKPDGILGPATRRAIQQLETRNGLTADGYPDQAVFDAATRAVAMQRNSSDT